MRARHYPTDEAIADETNGTALCGRHVGFRRPRYTVEAYRSALNREGMCAQCRRALESRERQAARALESGAFDAR
jgi:hypothetical protein